MQYLVPLDGIRAVAILAVLIFHVRPATLRGGFTGVDVFFVLSGFLITSISLHDLGEGRFSLKEFYLRRIQRLLPNAVLTVLATVVLWSFFMPPSTSRQPAVHGLWALVNLSNVYIWRSLGGYWGMAAESAPLTHTWSLGIEEQFYLLFPGALLLLVRLQPARVRGWLAAATLASFGACVVGTHFRASAAFYLLPTRVWELLLGATLAAFRATVAGSPPAIRSPLGEGIRKMAGWLGAALVLAGFVLIDEHKAFPGMIALVPALGTALLLLAVADGPTSVSGVLSSRVMVAIGKVSYSLYLWHWPLITFGKFKADLLGYPRLAGAVLGCLAGLVLAWLTYVLVEQPLRRRGPGRGWRFAIIGTGFACVAGFCAVESTRPRVIDPGKVFDPPVFAGKLFDSGRMADIDMKSFPRYSDVQCPQVPSSAVGSWRSGGVVRLNGGAKPRVVVTGSSHAMVYSRLIDDLCREAGIPVAFLVADNGTPAFFEAVPNGSFSSTAEAREYDEARRRWLREWRPDLLFAIDRWDSRPGGSKEFNERFRLFLQEVTPLVGRVAFVAQVPAVRGAEGVNLREYVLWRRRPGQGLPRLLPDSKETERTAVASLAEAAARDFPNLRVLRPDLAFYQPDGSIRYAVGRSFLYADADHLADAGAELVRDLFQQAIREATARPGESRPRN